MIVTESDIRAFLENVIQDDIHDGLLERLSKKPFIYDICQDVVEHDRGYLDQDVTRFAEIIKLCPKGENKLRILDVGAGVGFLAILLKIKGGHSVQAVDLRDSVLFWRERFEKYGINQIPCNIGLEPLPYQDGEFDIVVFSEVMEHLIGSPLKPLSEIRRVLKINGYLVLTTPNISSLPNIANLIRGRSIHPEIAEKVFTTNPRTPHVREYTLGELKDYLKNTGFRIDRVHMSRWMDKHINFKRIDLAWWQIIISMASIPLHRFRSCIMIRAQKVD